MEPIDRLRAIRQEFSEWSEISAVLRHRKWVRLRCLVIMTSAGNVQRMFFHVDLLLHCIGLID